MPGWVGVIILLRYLVPILGEVGSYFLFAHPVRFGSTPIAAASTQIAMHVRDAG